MAFFPKPATPFLSEIGRNHHTVGHVASIGCAADRHSHLQLCKIDGVVMSCQVQPTFLVGVGRHHHAVRKVTIVGGSTDRHAHARRRRGQRRPDRRGRWPAKIAILHNALVLFAEEFAWYLRVGLTVIRMPGGTGASSLIGAGGGLQAIANSSSDL